MLFVDKKTNASYSNWSGSVVFTPEKIFYPKSETELATFMKSYQKKIRIVGTAHSFSPVIETQDTLISLDEMQGVINVDRENLIVEAWAGTKLYRLNEELSKLELGLINMGDVDQQSIAGALCAGTHGTGFSLGVLANAIVGMTIITPQGEIKEITSKEELNIYRINLGMLGVVTKLKLKVDPAYKLDYIAKKEKLSTVIKNLESYYTQNRHFEFFWFPYSNVVQTRFSNKTDKKIKDHNIISKKINYILENDFYRSLCTFSKYVPKFSPQISKLCSVFLGGDKKVNESHKVFANPRDVRFQEMEYSIPIEHAKEVILKIDQLIKDNKILVNFPIEVRFVAKDDILLSPCYQRTNCFIAFHVFKGKEYKKYFSLMESMLAEYNGRPHWGKMSFQNKEYFKKQYPGFSEFNKLRKELDPTNKMLNPYLEKIFGE